MTGKESYLLALDQGTTSTRAIAYDLKGREMARRQIELKQHYPKPGWVEHDAEDIWDASLNVISNVVSSLGDRGQKPLALGITNQRETTVLWDRKTGKPVHNAIVWQDRRTADFCRTLKKKGLEPQIQEKTGLLLDPYFSAAKLRWLLENEKGVRKRAEKGEVCFGTVESYLLFRLSGGLHATDATNAARTLLYNIHKRKWDSELLDLFNIPEKILPEVIPNSFPPVKIKKGLFGEDFPVTAMIGDQQSAAVGQGCISPGAIKSTYGTGCFVLENTGSNAPVSENKLLTTVAYQVGDTFSYALEGSISIAGAVIQWLRDGLRFIDEAEHSERFAAELEHNQGVYLVPAFTGLGAPHWDPDARGAILGLTREVRPAHIIRAGLESVAYQTRDLLDAFEKDSGTRAKIVRVDGGMVANDWFVQFLSDILNISVERPTVIETTALGAAFLAGLGAGAYNSLDDIRSFWHLDRAFKPEMKAPMRKTLLRGWENALNRVKSDIV